VDHGQVSIRLVRLAMMIVDSQIHIWAADTLERPWPTNTPAKPHRSVPLTAEGVLAEMDGAGVSRAILVPPSWEGSRNDLSLQAARAHPNRFAVMGRLDTADPRTRHAMPTWCREQGMLGIRLTVRLPEEIEQLVNPDWDWIWAEAEAAQVPVMFFPYGHLPHVDALARRHPDLSLTIDHMAAYRTQGPEAFRDIDQLVALARYPNVAVKVSAVPFYSAEPYPFADTHDYVRRAFEAFGPKRTFWGSDLSRMRCPYRETVTMFTNELSWLRDEDLEMVMGKALCAWLRWP
jgi:L-fuconolactonase